MVCKEKMSQYPNLSAADIMAWIEGVVGTVGAAIIPKIGSTEPVYNQVFRPQTNAQPQFPGVTWPQQDPLQAARRLSSQQQRTPQQTFATAFPLEGGPHHSAFAHQMAIVSSPTPMPIGTYRRNDSFGGNAQGFRQEFQAAIHAGRYDREKERRPTNASHVSFNAYARSHSFESSSSNGQRRPYPTVQNEWQEGNFRAGATSQGSSSSLSPSRRLVGVGHEEFSRLDKGKGREISPSRHRSGSLEKYRGRQDSRSPAKKQPRPARQDDLGEHSPQAGAAADHSHPTFNAASGSQRQDIDTVTPWSQLNTPKPSDRVLADDSDVPTLTLDGSTLSEAPKSPLNVPQSTASEDVYPQYLQLKKPTQDAKAENISTHALELIKEQHVRRRSRSNRKQTTGEGFGDKPLRSSSDAARVLASTSSLLPPQKPDQTGDGVASEPFKRKESNEWQVAQGRRQHKEPTPKSITKSKNQSGKGQPTKPEESSRQRKPKQVKGKGASQERELSNRGEKKPREKQGIASARTHAHDANQSVDSAEGGKDKSQAKNQSNKGKEKDSFQPSPESHVAKQPRLNDSTETAFPCLLSPATPSANKNEVQPSMSWTAALQSATHRKAAEKLRPAAETDLPMSPDAVLVRRPSMLEIIVSVLSL